MTAADAYAAKIDAVTAQRERIMGSGERVWAGAVARRLRFDPKREPGPNLSVIGSYLEQGDTLLDVGGGAGRFALALAGRCKRVVNVDRSEGMRAEFDAAASEAGITNAEFIQAAWPAGGHLAGDVALVANVTYFVRDIVPFLEKLNSATRRRVIVDVISVPPPNQFADCFRLVYGEEQALLPGHEQLLPVLWEMGVLPEVRLLPEHWEAFASREAAIERALVGTWLRPEDRDRAKPLIEQHFDELFVATPAGLRPRRAERAWELLITWESGESR